MFQLTVNPLLAPNEPEYVEVSFEQGIPRQVNGISLGPVDLVRTLNELGGKHGVGRIDIVENRLVGMKSRGVYETPGGTILYRAHEGLEQLCLDKQTLQYKEMLALKYAELVYSGQWFTPLHEALDAFVAVTQQRVTGISRLRLFKGSVTLVGRRSPYSLYREDYATFGEEDVYNQADAEGFIKLFGLPLKVGAMLDVAGTGRSKYAAPDYSAFKRD
jgi:argininosuccinate synthase